MRAASTIVSTGRTPAARTVRLPPAWLLSLGDGPVSPHVTPTTRTLRWASGAMVAEVRFMSLLFMARVAATRPVYKEHESVTHG